MLTSRYKAACFAWLLFVLSYTATAQDTGVSFTSSDKKLEQAFVWAKDMALHYKGNANDPVGPWYEAALPSRYAFCMRDISHQCIGAEIIGLSPENYNMFRLFARNISASKDWCSYWEINKWGKPAPEDYRNDKAFWYNLPANFDVLYATWRLYLWTGDKRYINDPAFVNFQQKTIKEYIDQWVLAADSLLKRPAHPNLAIPLNEKDPFSTCRGLPSYSEGIPNLKIGVDLVAGLYRAMLIYAAILESNGQKNEATYYVKKAEQYHQHLESDWWDEQKSRYNTLYSNDGKFAMDETETFLIWFDALRDNSRLQNTVGHMATVNTNIENTSYYPYLFYKNDLWKDARKYILYISDPSTPRREYPEVSYGVIEGIVQGLMGITPDSREGMICTVLRMNDKGSAAIRHLPLLRTNIDVNHTSDHQSVLSNNGKQSFKWKAMFYGNYHKAYVNGKLCEVKKETDVRGNAISYVITTVRPGMMENVKVDN
ncbi:MAG TPA: hypothetical protein VK671_00805 [Mucilaginibacter sp.]|nr:hypothetical protein [Mucilaginibacter sp.]